MNFITNQIKNINKFLKLLINSRKFFFINKIYNKVKKVNLKKLFIKKNIISINNIVIKYFYIIIIKISKFIINKINYKIVLKLNYF